MNHPSQSTADYTNYIEYMRDLTEDQMRVRERVVNEYLYDFNWQRACLRCGFRPEFSSDYAQKFATDPYCLWRVKELSRERGLNPDEQLRKVYEDQERVDIINALKREANYFGPGSSQAARVSALGKLAQLKGMEPARNTKVEVKATPGVLVTPGIASVDDWESVAEEQQERLRLDTMAAIQRGSCDA